MIDSALVFPYYTKVILCAQCGDKFVVRYYGEVGANLEAGCDANFEIERHVKNCFGKEYRANY